MVYISIESRKGGVGKTTTALTLSEILLSEGYQVLMVDMDIVGTTIDSTFMDAHQNAIHEVKLGGNAVNIVRLFKDVYLTGKNVPAFAREEENNDKAFTFALGKCNFIGSNIYETPKGTMPLEDPRILYDAYHAYWLLEFVKGISKSFAVAMSQNAKVAVILDNSPGFSSVENSIHDYLTDLGPEGGKILLVSTIDPQDIEACRQSKYIIEKRFNDKVAAGEYYRSLSEGRVGKKIATSDFDSVWNSLCASNGRQPEYHSYSHETTKPFVNILVNKVPQNIFDQLFEKDIIHKNSENATPFQNHLLYYFSNPQLTIKDIIHKQSYTERFGEFYQSGRVKDIEQDNVRYLEFCVFSRKIGMGNFFKEEWAPKTYFVELINNLKMREALKKQPEWNISLRDGTFVNRENKIMEEVKTVSEFVRVNLRAGTQLKDVLPLVEDYVTSTLWGLEDNVIIDFHPDHPKLQEIGDFVTIFGLAVYRLHIYEQVCELFNNLISFCLNDADNLEKLNKDSMSSWIENVLEGRIVGKDVVEIIVQMLDDQRNARELSNALQVIIRSWEL